MFTCIIRYAVDPERLAGFEAYGRAWIRLIEEYGGVHHGYFLPDDGTTPMPDPTFSFPGLGVNAPPNVGFALFSFPSVDAYERYKRDVAGDPRCAAATEAFEAAPCFTSYERCFSRPLLSAAASRTLVFDRFRSIPRSTARLTFRWWTRDDEALAMALWGDPRVTAHIDARGTLSREMVLEILARQIAFAEAHGIQYWPIFSRDTGEHLGCAGLRPYGPDPSRAEIGFHIRHDHWRRGFAREAAFAVMEHAFEVRGLEGVFAGHNPDNTDSRRLLGKLGFVYVRDELYAPTGRMHPSYEMTADDWLRRCR